jgi:hypothetical protein
MVSTVFCCLLVCVGAASAATLEAPTAEAPTELRAVSAVLRGTLGPNRAAGSSEQGFFEFVYRQSGSECEGAGQVKSQEGFYSSGNHEEVGMPVEGLTAGTTYTACLIVHNETNTESAESGPVTFTTTVPPEAPETSPTASAVTATSAELAGVLNPKASGETGWHFLYNVGTTCAGGAESAGEPPAVAKARAVHTVVAGLQPRAKYAYCLVATDAAGDTTASVGEGHFETLSAPPEVTGTSSQGGKRL